jgi:hypothetical protein
MTKQEIIKIYEQLTGRIITELPNNKVQYTENRKTGQVTVKRQFSEIERYVILKSQPTNTSINKNTNKTISKNTNTCINSELASAVKSIFVERPNREKYKTIACSIPLSDYKKLQNIAKKQDTTIYNIMKRLVNLVIKTQGE